MQILEIERSCRLWRWKEIKGVAVHGNDERHQIIIIDICNMLCNLYNTTQLSAQLSEHYNNNAPTGLRVVSD